MTHKQQFRVILRVETEKEDGGPLTELGLERLLNKLISLDEPCETIKMFTITDVLDLTKEQQ